MKASFFKTVFLLFMYLGFAYLLTYCLFEHFELIENFKVVDNWDKVNRIFLMFISIILLLAPMISFVAALAVVVGYFKKLKEERFYK